MWYQYIKIVVTQACCQNSGITHFALQMIKTLPKLRFFNDKNSFSGWGSAWCVAAEESERGPPRGVARWASELEGGRVLSICPKCHALFLYKIIISVWLHILTHSTDQPSDPFDLNLRATAAAADLLLEIRP